MVLAIKIVKGDGGGNRMRPNNAKYEEVKRICKLEDRLIDDPGLESLAVIAKKNR